MNNTNELLLINWVDWDGAVNEYNKVASESVAKINTYSTHAWQITDQAGYVISEFKATNENFQIFEIHTDKQVVYQPTPIPAPTLGPAVPIGERAFADRPDDFPGLYQIHILYVLPSDAADQQRDINGKFSKSVEASNEWFFEQSGGSKLRFDTYQGELDITFIQLEQTSDQIYDTTVAQYGGPYWIRDTLETILVNMNFLHPGKLYIAMFDINKHPTTCADAAHPPDLMGRVSGFYTNAWIQEGGYSCPVEEIFGIGSNIADMGIPHEVGHLLGFAASCGKNPTSSENQSHTGDFTYDLMWAPTKNSTLGWDVDRMALDPGNDDYFNHDILNCPDLAKSVFLDPLPENPETPPNWPDEWKLP